MIYLTSIMTIAKESPSLRFDLIALAIIGISFAVRYWFAATGQLDLVQDEAQYWDWIRRPQLSYYSKGPLIAWVITLWSHVFGSTELGVRFGAVLGMTGIQVALYTGVSRVWREYRLAVFVVFVAATIPLLNGLGFLMTTDNPLIFCWTIAFFALSAATRHRPDMTPSNRPFVILGICIALGILAKYMMLVFVALAVVYSAILYFRGQLPARFWWRFWAASILGIIVGMLPILMWNWQNSWVGFKHVAGQAAGRHASFSLRFGPFLEMVGAQIGLFAPWWFVCVLVATWKSLKKSIIGPIGAFDEQYRHDLQAVIFFLPLWATISLWTLKSHTEANWPAAAFMAGAVLGGMGFRTWWTAPERSKRGPLSVAGVALVVTLAIYILPTLSLPGKYNLTNRLKGWANIGTQIGEVIQSELNDPTKVFVFSDKYDITSELAFYVPGQPKTYCVWLFDRRMNQYDLWPGPDLDKVGWDAVFVQEQWHQAENAHPEIEKMFDHVGPPILTYSVAQGHNIRPFTLRVCKGYNGYWSRFTGNRF